MQQASPNLSNMPGTDTSRAEPAAYSTKYLCPGLQCLGSLASFPERPLIVLMVNKSTKSDLDSQGIKNNESTSPEY